MRLLSRKVSGKEPFYMEVACLEKNLAEMVAYCHAYKIMFPDDHDFNQFLDEKAIPVLKRVGMATWPRDVLTDMGLRMGESQANFSLKGASFGKQDEQASDGATNQPV